MPSDERWLEATWPWVQSQLPAPPARVVEIGCGTLGGFVPMLERAGYGALGIDPRAPVGASFRRCEFERTELPARVGAVVACTSLHHVSDPGAVLGKVAETLTPGGVIVVVEWDWQSFDEATARWCFERLAPEHDQPHNWLLHHRQRWQASGEPWTSHRDSWADEERLHSGERLLGELDRRFDPVRCERGPYFFAHLAATTEDDELEAIGRGEIRANRINYVGSVPAG